MRRGRFLFLLGDPDDPLGMVPDRSTWNRLHGIMARGDAIPFAVSEEKLEEMRGRYPDHDVDSGLRVPHIFATVDGGPAGT